MAYDEYLGERIARILKSKNIVFFEKKMMGGLVFMVNNKMCCGIHIDKKFGDSLLMAKVGEEAAKSDLHKKDVLPMDFTGRPMKGFIYIKPTGFDMDADLEYWVHKTLAYSKESYGKT